MDNIEYHTTLELAALMRVSEQTLRHWRMQRKGPPFVKFGRRALYPLAAFDTWAAKQTTHPDDTRTT